MVIIAVPSGANKKPMSIAVTVEIMNIICHPVNVFMAESSGGSVVWVMNFFFRCRIPAPSIVPFLPELFCVFAARIGELPDYVRVLVVPHSLPKTKPKACNYGLNYARGDFLVIYDAEDIPEPHQLKKAYLGFENALDSVKCLQAKLNYYNPDHNLLTRLFTAEYSLWFEVILPGLQSVNGYIPLGGTSNHFRTRDLITLEGWDPFNVTEDCDLGARIFKRGWRTAIIDSVTLEEANSNAWNWLRQRSRWIKG